MNPLDSFGIVGGFFLRTFQQFMGNHDLLGVGMIFLYAFYRLLTGKALDRTKKIAWFLMIPLVIGTLHLGVLEAGLTFRTGLQESLGGEGGGVLGFLVAFAFLKLFGSVASYLVAGLSLMLLLLYVTDFPFAYMGTKIKALFSLTSRRPQNGQKNKAEKQAVSMAPLPMEVSPKAVLPVAEKETEKKLIPILNNFEFESTKSPREKEQEKKEPAEILSFPVIAEGENKVISIAEKKKEKMKEKEKIQEEVAEGEDFTLKGPEKGKTAQAYSYPSLEILKQNESSRKNDEEMINQRARILESTLENFGVKGKVVGVSCGPAITRYEFMPAPGIKVSKIVNLTDDIALSMATSGVRIAPIPGKNAIGLEIPNTHNSSVAIRSVLESQDFRKSNSKLSVALGKDIAGKPVIADLKKMPHLLVAGATGSGKSVCMNSIISSILFNASPDEVKLILVDPKMVELTVYNGIPHLITPVVTDPKKAASALRWAVKEMENRYQIFSVAGVKSIEVYNENMDKGGQPEGKLPFIVVMIDELSDLMMVAPADVEDAICRIAQMARAAGIHLVIATQRPSVNVITGIIKANIPSRIAFAVSSQVDSRTILDMNGAEKLLGKGDMLYYPAGVPKPFRVQGVFISDEEIENLVMEIKAKGVPRYDERVISQELEQEDGEGAGEEEEDELIPEAAKLFIENGQASISILQRRFRIGYNRAARIIDQMERKGIIGGYEGSKPRQILINLDDFDNIFGR